MEPFWEPSGARNRPLGRPFSAEKPRSLLDRSSDALPSFFGSLWGPFASLSPPFWDPFAPIRFPSGSLRLPERRVVLAAFIKEKSVLFSCRIALFGLFPCQFHINSFLSAASLFRVVLRCVGFVFVLKTMGAAGVLVSHQFVFSSAAHQS